MECLGGRGVEAAGFPCPVTVAAPSVATIPLEESSSAAGAGGPGGLAGIRPAPLWRLPRGTGHLRGTGRAGRGSGGRVLRGGALEAAVEPEG